MKQVKNVLTLMVLLIALSARVHTIMNQNIIFTKLNADLFPFLAKSLPGRTSRFFAFLDLYEQQIKDIKVFGHYALEIPFFVAYQDLSERWNWDRKTVMLFLQSLQKMGVIEVKREYRRVTVRILNLAIAPLNSISETNEDST